MVGWQCGCAGREKENGEIKPANDYYVLYKLTTHYIAKYFRFFLKILHQTM
jgi:hypothetical protein